MVSLETAVDPLRQYPPEVRATTKERNQYGSQRSSHRLKKPTQLQPKQWVHVKGLCTPKSYNTTSLLSQEIFPLHPIGKNQRKYVNTGGYQYGALFQKVPRPPDPLIIIGLLPHLKGDGREGGNPSPQPSPYSRWDPCSRPVVSDEIVHHALVGSWSISTLY